MISTKKILYAFTFSVAGLFFLFSSLTATVEAQTWKKLVDYGMEGYSETTNNWETYVFPDSPGGSYRYLSRLLGDHSRTGTATWKTTIPYCGLYEVKVSCRKTENRTSDADYYVTNSTGGEDHFVINQKNHANILDWDTLGGPGTLYYYEKDQPVRVHLDGTDDGSSDCADAASWELIKPMRCEGDVKVIIPVPQNHLLLKTPVRK